MWMFDELYFKYQKLLNKDNVCFFLLPFVFIVKFVALPSKCGWSIYTTESFSEMLSFRPHSHLQKQNLHFYQDPWEIPTQSECEKHYFMDVVINEAGYGPLITVPTNGYQRDHCSGSSDFFWEAKNSIFLFEIWFLNVGLIFFFFPPWEPNKAY